MSHITLITMTGGEIRYPSQNGYRVSKTVSGQEIGLSKLADPSDPLFVSEDAAVVMNDPKDIFLDDEEKNSG